MLSPRLMLFLLGAGMAWFGGHQFGEVRREDAPLRRALGPAGVPVEAVVYSQRSASSTDSKGNSTSFTMTNLDYQHAGQRYSADIYLPEPTERSLPRGGIVSCRLDPENPSFITSAKAPWPWTKTKLTLCVLTIVLGVLLDLGVLANLAR